MGKAILIEVTAKGFKGDDSSTDDRVLWVRVNGQPHMTTENARTVVECAISGCEATVWDALPSQFLDEGNTTDFTLPGQEKELRAKLEEFKNA